MTIEINVYVHLASVDEIQRITQTLAHLVKIGDRTMTTVAEYVAQTKDYQDRQDAALEGIKDDIQGLNEKLTAIQNSPGTLSAEDQASLDAALARTAAATTKLEALDSQTPPAPPVA